MSESNHGYIISPFQLKSSERKFLRNVCNPSPRENKSQDTCRNILTIPTALSETQPQLLSSSTEGINCSSRTRASGWSTWRTSNKFWWTKNTLKSWRNCTACRNRLANRSVSPSLDVCWKTTSSKKLLKQKKNMNYRDINQNSNKNFITLDTRY